MNKLARLLSIGLIGTLCSCGNHPEPSVGSLTLEFDNRVGSANLDLSTVDMPYTNSQDEPFRITRLQYYVSNIKLKREDGSVFKDNVNPDGSSGYYLINEANAESQEVTLEGIFTGNFTEVTFTAGVDVAMVNQQAATGALDPANEMFRDWDTGFIGMAVEGGSSASQEDGNHFSYHISGYKSDPSNADFINNVKTVTLDFNGDMAPVRAGHEPEVHLIFDLSKLFNGTEEELTFSTNAVRETPVSCAGLADNMAAAFVVDHVHEN